VRRSSGDRTVCTGRKERERERERESARGRGKEEERKTSAEAIGGASAAAAAAILKKSPWTSLKNSTAVAVGAPPRSSLFVRLAITTALLSLPMQLGS